MRVVIRASDVAAAIGLNRYKPASEVRDEIWKRYKPETFLTKTKTDEAQEAIGKSTEACASLAQALSHRAKNSADAEVKFKEVEAKINSDSKLDATEKAKVIEYARSKVYTTHGTRKEDQTATLSDLKLERDNKKYTFHVAQIGDVEYVVVGMIDRLEILPDGSKTLVEIKNRMKCLFHTVREYEMCQVQMYLEMLDLENAKLIEQYNSQIEVHEIKRDRDFFNHTILYGLQTFCHELDSVLN